MKTETLVIFVIVLTALSINAHSDDVTIDSLHKGSDLKRNPVFTPLQILMGDTLIKDYSKEKKPNLPGGYSDKPEEFYTEEQNENYQKAIRLNLPSSVRLNEDLKSSETAWLIDQELMKGKPLQIAMRNIESLPREYFLPSDVEKVHHQLNLENALWVPGIQTYNRYGLKVNLQDIGAFFGVVEDVSPVITYNLEYPTDVKIVVYSIQAVVISTLFEGVQPAGPYKITWNGRDDKGKKMPKGDYVAEVRVGKDRIIRKRIVIP